MHLEAIKTTTIQKNIEEFMSEKDYRCEFIFHLKFACRIFINMIENTLSLLENI
jgi:hypothetical protein